MGVFVTRDTIIRKIIMKIFWKLLSIGILVFLLCVGIYRYLRVSIPVSTPLVVLSEKMEHLMGVVSTPVSAPQITLDRIFGTDHTWIRTLPEEHTVTMIATGDVIPARSVNYKMVNGKGFRWPFEKTADVLSGADLTVINLETPLLASCPTTVEGMLFCGDARAVEGLTYAGVDIATLGNNHVGNHYIEGVEETKSILTRAGITSVSEGITYKDLKGMRFAFLAYNDIGTPEAGVPWADENKIQTDIREARLHADIVIVAYHWGEEYVTMPGDRQVALAHLSVDAGADVVLGNHPHWIQPIELYKEKFIIYAHGNFVFDQEWSPETKLGVIGRYVFYEKKLVDIEYIPLRIVDYGQPYFLEGEERQKVLSSMKESSFLLAR